MLDLFTNPQAQVAFNIMASVAAMLGGWVLKSIHQALKDLQAADLELVKKVQAVELLVAGNYVKKTDFDHTLDALFHKLDRIELKLDRKVDKNDVLARD